MEYGTMRFLFIIILHILCMPTLSFGICPSPSTMNPRTANGQSLCANVFLDESCGGEQRDVSNGEQTSILDDHWGSSISSLVVREGCQLTVYSAPDYDDGDYVFEGVHDYLGNEMNDWDNKIQSYTCDCIFNPVDCEPRDWWADGLVCSVPPGGGEMKCKYNNADGYYIGDEINNGYNLTSSINDSLAEELRQIYAEAMEEGSSNLTTGYNWAISPAFTGEFPRMEISIEFEVHGGETKESHQLMSMCNTSIVYTDCLRVVDKSTKAVLKTECPEYRPPRV